MIKNGIRKVGNYLTTAYLVLMFCIYPFYMQNGYTDIGEAKNNFFIRVSLSAFFLLLFFFMIRFVSEIVRKRKAKEAYLIDWSRVSSTDLLLMILATVLFLSYAFSPYKEEALWGETGWYMGCIPLLLLCGLTFLISRMWKGERSLIAGGILVSGIIFLLAVCNRFSFYPIDTVVIQSDFVSTLGNINWFCGYLSVVAPLGIGLFVLDEEGSGKDGHILRRQIKRGALLVYTILTFVAGFCQGSSSIFIWYGALFFLLLWICVEKEKWIKNWFLMIALWGSSAQLVRLWRYIAPERYNYDVDNACGYFTDSGLTLWIAIAGFCGYLILCLRSRKRTEEKKAGEEDGTVSDKEKRTKINSKSKIFRKILVCVLLIVAAAWIGLIVINTCVGIPFLEENQMFLFDRNWGNGRGSAWQAAFAMLKEMPFLQKLIGVGPDGFADLAYSLPEVSDMLYEEFGNSRLTNAHCELLTCLVNWGVAGTLAYLGMFISFTIRCFRRGKEKPVLYAMAVCLLCYLCHNVVSFAQVLNIPFVFLILGMGEALLRKSQNAQEIKDETQSGAGCGASFYECED